MKKRTIIFAAICFIGTSVFAQQAEKRREISFSAGPMATQIKNKNIKEDRNKVVDDKAGYNFDVLYTGYLRGKGLGLSIGFGYSSYQQVIYQKGLFEHFSQTDKDGNMYDEWLKSDMTYTKKISMLDVPLNIHILFGTSDQYNVYMDLGVLNEILISGDNTEKGSIENMGKYDSGNPYFPLVSQNNPYYDYHTENYDKTYSDQYQRYNVAGHFAMGLAVAMNDHLSFKGQVYTNVGFNDVTAKAYRDIKYENIIEVKQDYEKTKLFAVGLNLGFILRL